MAEVIEFPFDSGAYEAADREWLPPNMLAVAENVRLGLDGRLEVRPGFSALTQNTMSANSLTAYDVGNYAGRLVALGTQTTGATRPTDLFEYLESRTRWRATAGDNTTVRMPQLTDVREIGRLQDQQGLPRTVGLAYGAGYLCSAVSMSDEVQTIIHVFRPDTDQTVLLASVELEKCKVAYAGTDFWIVGVDADDDICEVHFDPSSDTALSSVTTLLANGIDVNDLAIASNGTNFVWAIAGGIGIGCVGQLHNGTTGANIQTLNANAQDSNAVGVTINTAGTRISFARRDTGTNTYDIETLDNTGASIVGPTALFGGFVTTPANRLAAWQDGSNVRVLGMGEDTAILETVVQNTHANVSGPSALRDAYPAAAGVMVGTSGFFGVQDETSTSDGQGTFHISEVSVFLPQCFLYPRLQSFHSKIQNIMNQMATDGSDKIYFPVIWVSENTGNDPIRQRYSIIEARTLSSDRRQMAELAGELHISGGLPLVYDGRALSEQGFVEQPAIASITQATNGSLTALGVYSFKAVWEVWDGKHLLLRSQSSETNTITLTGSNDELQLLISTPHSLRCHPLFANARFTVRVAVYRTEAGGANFFLDNFEVFDTATADFGDLAQVNLTQADSSLRDNLVLYEQSQTPVPHVGPQPYKYVWPARERLIYGGQPETEQWSFSKLVFPREPVEFASNGRLGFSGRTNQAITAVAAFETVGLAWTASEIAQIPGRGPEHSGTGEFDTALLVPSPGGCSDWRSVVVSPPGAFFQMSADKLMLLQRGQQNGGGVGDVVWIGQAVRQTLALFPVITGAVHLRTQMQVVFSCNDTGGTDGRLLVYDLRRNQWFVDDVGGPITAITEYLGRLVYLSAGVVYHQHTAAGSGTFVSYTVETGMMPLNSERLGWGLIYDIGILGEAVGACSIQALIDYDDGSGFRDLGTKALAGTEGAQELFWSLAVQKTSRFSLRFVVTSASSNSRGIRLKGWAAKVQGSKNMVRVGSGGWVA